MGAGSLLHVARNLNLVWTILVLIFILWLRSKQILQLIRLLHCFWITDFQFRRSNWIHSLLCYLLVVLLDFMFFVLHCVRVLTILLILFLIWVTCFVLLSDITLHLIWLFSSLFLLALEVLQLGQLLLLLSQHTSFDVVLASNICRSSLASAFLRGLSPLRLRRLWPQEWLEVRQSVFVVYRLLFLKYSTDFLILISLIWVIFLRILITFCQFLILYQLLLVSFCWSFI